MADYSFLTVWLVDAPIERVYGELHDVSAWPGWWPGVTRTREVAAGDPDGLGTTFEIAWRSFIPYELEFEITVTALDPPYRLEGRAEGALEGTGCWRLFHHEGLTAATYAWDVRTTKRWMNLLAPVARPVFAFNHDYVMKAGGKGLARRVMKRPSG